MSVKPVVMEMGSLAQPSITNKSTQKQSKIPEYAKDFKNEWLYIRGINKLCGEFMKKLGDNTDSFEKVFGSSRAKGVRIICEPASHARRASHARHASHRKI